MHDFTRKLITEWRKLDLPFANETFIIAVSGGADSVGLLLALHELRGRKKLENRFVVAHFNHNLRGADSDKDAEFVRGLTTELNFEFVYKIQHTDSAIQNQKGNLEQNARDARYEFLIETAENLHAEFVLTAHTLNDQAETFLMNLIRGSGLEGLGGMKILRSLKSKAQSLKSEESFDTSENLSITTPNSAIKLARPLLSWAKREDTENFCRLNRIEFRHDAMNDDLKFNRVRIRKILLPLLKDFNPKIIETLAQTAEILRQSAEQLSVNDYQSAINNEQPAESGKTRIENQPLQLKDLRDVFPTVLRTILREWLENNRGNLRGLELKHIEAIEKLIASRRSGKIVELPKGESILKKDGKLYFQSAKVEKNQTANYNRRL
jgi:tRNA(Ile)-lysidine synthase